MKERAAFHAECASAAHSMGADREGLLHVLFRIEAAIHSLGATVAMSNQTEVDANQDAIELEKALEVLNEKVDAHQHAIEKAHKGLSPWGEILRAGEELKQAVQRLRAR